MISLPYIYSNETNLESKRAVIVLPEIFGLTDTMKEIADRFANDFKCLAFSMDFFYPLTGKVNSLDYETEGNVGFGMMQKLTAEQFLEIFNETIAKIQEEYPNVTEIVVCGFCFGGRLAYLSGLNKAVKKIISFYGSGSLNEYFKGKGVVEITALARYDTELRVIGIFGGTDTSIPEIDRATIKNIFDKNRIGYQEVVYSDAGHAFFNHHRPNYNENAAGLAWQKIQNFLN